VRPLEEGTGQAGADRLRLPYTGREVSPDAPAADLDDPAVSIERLTAEPADAKALERIGRESFPDRPFRVDEELARPWTRFWVARQSAAGHDDAGDTTGPGVGFVIAWHVADELHVLSIATAPAERRRGIATALMRVALDYASAERVRLVLLEVRRSNRAAL